MGGSKASALPGICLDAHSEVVGEKGISSSQAGGLGGVNLAPGLLTLPSSDAEGGEGRAL